MKVIGLLVDFYKIIKLWHLCTCIEFSGVWQKLPATIWQRSKFDDFLKIKHKTNNFHIWDLSHLDYKNGHKIGVTMAT